MSPADSISRLYSFLFAFMGAMLGAVLSGNVILLVFSWGLRASHRSCSSAINTRTLQRARVRRWV